MSTKHSPATPLPWHFGSAVNPVIWGANSRVCYADFHPLYNEDAAYIVAACNAYPRLIAALETVAALSDSDGITTGKPLSNAIDQASTLLRELGEL